MSFQGDVREIGLAELLQGLARGQRSGVLTLTARDGHRVVLGMARGRVAPLAPEGEDPERWRTPARDAWADDPGDQTPTLHMETVADARRLDQLYDLLDGSDVRFHFEPEGESDAGDSPEARNGSAAGAALASPTTGTEVEHLLLEYARVQDEYQRDPIAGRLTRDQIPTLTGIGEVPSAALEEAITGTRTVQEIADRRGWPLRRARAALARGLRDGSVGLRHWNEFLDLALECLNAGQESRAVRRLTAWTRFGSPGPMPRAAAQHLASPRLAGGLDALLRALQARPRRTLLRRLYASLNDPVTAARLWKEVAAFKDRDPIAHVRSLRPPQGVSRPTGDAVPLAPAPVGAWISLARRFMDMGTPDRGVPFLVRAARHGPAGVDQQVELGLLLIRASRVAEGGPWILAGARSMLAEQRAGEAIQPLRALLEHDSRNRAARLLLARVLRASGQPGSILRPALTGRYALALLVGSVLVAAAALVKVRGDRNLARHLEEVRSLAAQPALAQARLLELFGDDTSSEVQTLRDELVVREQQQERGLRLEWLALYEDVQREATVGDPVLALDRILAMPDPPRLRRVAGAWPAVADLHPALAQRLIVDLDSLEEPRADAPVQVQVEDRLTGHILALLARLEEIEPKTPAQAEGVEALTQSLVESLETIEVRRGQRAIIVRDRRHAKNLAQQETWLRQADALEARGEFGRAVHLYEDILRLDDSGQVAVALADQIAEVTSKHQTVVDARRLALAGQHEQALEQLSLIVEDLTPFPLPWRVRTVPAGALVERKDSPAQNAPFQLQSADGETVILRVTHPGYLPRILQVDGPGNQKIILSRKPERSWSRGARIDALPMAVGDDHLVADRDAHLARLGADGEVIWEQHLEAISGLARAPLFLPQRPGHILVVSEGGRAWMLDVDSGEVEGPLELGAAPVTGPAPSADCISVRLADGRGLAWTRDLEPEQLGNVNASDLNHDAQRFGGEPGLRVQRRREDPERKRFANPWGGGRVVLGDEAYTIHWAGEDSVTETVLREGDWEYVAWERPGTWAPLGRLWISDEAGLRAFVPAGKPAVEATPDQQ